MALLCRCRLIQRRGRAHTHVYATNIQQRITELLKRKAALDEQEEVLREAAGDALDMFSIEVRIRLFDVREWW